VGTPVERQNLSYAFFILAALIALSTLWAVYDEFYTRRPWKLYQAKFREVAEQKARAELDDARKQLEANKAEIDKLKGELDQAGKALAGSELAELKRKQNVLDLEVKDVKQEIAFRKSDLDAVYYQYRHAKEQKHFDDAKRSQKKLAELAEVIARHQAALDKSEAEYAGVSSRINGILSKHAEIQKKLEALTEPVTEAQRKIAAAKAEGGSLEQYWIPALDKVDRCQNCHLAVDRCGYSAPWEILAAKNKGLEDDAAIAKRFCITPTNVGNYATVAAGFCEGDPLPADAPDLACADAATLGRWDEVQRLYCAPGKAPAKWVVKDGKPCAPKDALAALEAAEKGKDYNIPFVFQTHPSRDEIIGNNHPAEKFGCTACHGGEGVQTKGIAGHEFAHGEDDPYWDVWQDPLLAKVRVWGKKTDLTAAACNKCHKADIELEHAGQLNDGKKLFAQVGCYGCHPTEGFNDLRKPGPQLTDMKAKVTSPGWLVSWIGYPRSFRPRTSMPNFWPEAIDDATVVPGKSAGQVKAGSKEHQLRDEEATAIAAYLWNTSTGPLPERSLDGTVEEGARVFDAVGCRGCHATEAGDVTRPPEGTQDRDFAPNLHNIGSKTTANWIYTWIKDPKGYWPHAKMPSLRLSDREAGSIAKWLAAKKGEESYPVPAVFEAGYPAESFQELSAKGKGLIAKYGCFGCHDVKGFEDAQRIGADLTEFGSKAVDLLDFGDAVTNPVKQTWFNWTDTKLRHPRIYRYERVDTRMPQFDFSDAEVVALMTFLKGSQSVKIPHQYLAAQDARKKAVIAGEREMTFYGCRNCHVIEKEGGAIRDRYPEDQITLAPPVIQAQGFKTQPAWLFNFIKDPGSVQIRPWLTVRMPTFGFTDAEATRLVHGFSAADNSAYPYVEVEHPRMTPAAYSQAKALFTDLKCLSCHTTGKPAPGVSLADLAPDLTLAKKRLRPEWIPAWLADPNKLMEGTRMPAFWPDGQSPLPQYFGGDSKKQWDALRDYIISLGGGRGAPVVTGDAKPKAAPKPAPAPAKPGKKKAEAPAPDGTKTAAFKHP
jgi:cytochrome c2